MCKHFVLIASAIGELQHKQLNLALIIYRL